MGYSYTNDAGRAMDKIEALCVKSTGMSNTWKHKGASYFVEVARKDQPDGGIRGPVMKLDAMNRASRVGRLVITGDGRIMEAAGGLFTLLYASAGGAK